MTPTGITRPWLGWGGQSLKASVLGVLLLVLSSLFHVRGASQVPTATNEAVRGPGQVLVLQSDGSGAPFAELFTSAFLSEFTDQGGSIKSVRIEYLDLVRGSDRPTKDSLIEHLRRKYADTRFDIVVTVNPAATELAFGEGAFLTRNAPIVSLYPGQTALKRAEGKVGLIGSIFDFGGTLKLALALKPDAHRVLFVAGSGPSDRLYEEQAEKSFEPWRGKLVFESTSNLSFPEILARVSEAREDTIVIYSTIFGDKAGDRFIPKEAAVKVVKASKQPVFGTYEPLLGTGVVGGSMLSVSENGRRIARLALDALRGNDPIPGTQRVVVFPNSPLPMFDWPELKRHGLDPERLPQGAIFLRRPPGPWVQYKSEIISALVVIVILTSATLTLAFENRRRKEAERIALEKQKWVQILIDEAPEAIVVYDADIGRYIDANPAAERLFGFKREELLRSGPEGLFPATQPGSQDVLGRIAEHARKALDGEKFYVQGEIHSLDGRLIPCQVHLTRFPAQDRRLVRVSFLDLSELRQAEADLQRSQANLRALIENTADIIWSVDLDFKTLTFNQALADQIQGRFGKRIEIGMLPSEILPLEGVAQWTHLYERVLSEGAFRQEHTPFSDGRRFELSFNPIRQDGAVVGISVFGKDITEQIRLREQLNQSQKMEAVGQLAGGIAHDFNNVLTGIISAAELLCTSGLSSDQRRRFVDLILVAAERAGGLTKKLLAFSRKAVKSSTPVDVAAIVNDAVGLLRRTLDKRVEILVENQASGTHVVGDDALLQNAFLNMGINAGHAMPEGGSLTFRLENTFLDEAYCSHSPFSLEPGAYLQISVQDTGCGMPPETLNRVFEPFFTTREQGKGTGLGLSAAYGTVQDHHGAIQAYSEPGRGTVFTVYLPLATDVRGAVVAETPIDCGQGTILLIDDEEIIRISGKAMLEGLGYTVLTAENGLVGLSVLAERKGEVQLVILDMIMPVLGGRDTLRRVREIDHNVPVIVCSGFSKDGEIPEMRGEGTFWFLHKPFRRAELATAVAEALRGSVS